MHRNGEPVVGAPRIHGALRTLGVDVSERTVLRLLEHTHMHVGLVSDAPRVGTRVLILDGTPNRSSSASDAM
jgi:hypothetical protein